jgi:hypothetical protein
MQKTYMQMLQATFTVPGNLKALLISIPGQEHYFAVPMAAMMALW